MAGRPQASPPRYRDGTNRRGRACPVPPADGPNGAGDRKGRPYGTATARTVGDGLVPSRQPTEPRWRGRPQGSPPRYRDGTNRRGRACPVPPAAAPMARATARVAPTAPRRHEPQGTGLSRPASRSPLWPGDHKRRPHGTATARTVGDGLVPSRQPRPPMARATARVAPTTRHRFVVHPPHARSHLGYLGNLVLSWFDNSTGIGATSMQRRKESQQCLPDPTASTIKQRTEQRWDRVTPCSNR